MARLELMLVYLVELDGGVTDEQSVDPGAFPPARTRCVRREHFSTRLFWIARRVLWYRICWRYRILLGRAEIVASGRGCVRRCSWLLGPAVAPYSRSRGPARCSDACRCTAGARAALSEGAEWQNESRYRRYSYD